MPDALCDQCGKRITEEDFAAGRAFRDRADVFCADCAMMYAQAEKERKRRETAEIAAKRTRPPTGAARRRSTSHSRTVGRGMLPRRPAVAIPPMVFLVIAAAIAVVAIAVIVVVLRAEGRPSTGASAAPVITVSPVPAPSATPNAPATQTPATPAQPAPDAGDERRPQHGRSLFGPGGELDTPQGR